MIGQVQSGWGAQGDESGMTVAATHDKGYPCALAGPLAELLLPACRRVPVSPRLCAPQQASLPPTQRRQRNAGSSSMQAQLTAGCAQRAQAPFTAARQQAKRRVVTCSAARQQQGQLAAAAAVALQAAVAAPALAASEAVGQVGDGSMAMALTGGAALAGLAAVLVATDPTHRCGWAGGKVLLPSLPHLAVRGGARLLY